VRHTTRSAAPIHGPRARGGPAALARPAHAAALALALAACAPRPTRGAGASFDCGGVLGSVRFRGDSALVSLPDTLLRLPRALSGSGARYSDGASTYWEHQGTARIETPGDTLHDCVLRPR
jgi:membrane-bound inhibitor of C-type lysozyme